MNPTAQHGEPLLSPGKSVGETTAETIADTMSDLPGEGDETAPGRLANIAYFVGGIGLLGATAADSLAVAGRHTGFHLLGSIELVQAMVVMLGASAMLIVTLADGHASVHILTERVSRPAAARLHRLAALLSGIAFLLLAAGSAWVAADLWHGFEFTELLHIPLRWLRLFWIIVALTIGGIFILRAGRRAA